MIWLQTLLRLHSSTTTIPEMENKKRASESKRRHNKKRGKIYRKQKKEIAKTIEKQKTSPFKKRLKIDIDLNSSTTDERKQQNQYKNNGQPGSSGKGICVEGICEKKKEKAMKEDSDLSGEEGMSGNTLMNALENDDNRPLATMQRQYSPLGQKSEASTCKVSESDHSERLGRVIILNVWQILPEIFNT